MQSIQIPDASHPIWIFLRNATLVFALYLVLKYNYTTFDPVKDPRSIIIMAIIGLGFDSVKRMFAPPAKPTPE